MIRVSGEKYVEMVATTAAVLGASPHFSAGDETCIEEVCVWLSRTAKAMVDAVVKECDARVTDKKPCGFGGWTPCILDEGHEGDQHCGELPDGTPVTTGGL